MGLCPKAADYTGIAAVFKRPGDLNPPFQALILQKIRPYKD
jgi:hypothetical protein